MYDVVYKKLSAKCIVSILKIWIYDVNYKNYLIDVDYKNYER